MRDLIIPRSLPRRSPPVFYVGRQWVRVLNDAYVFSSFKFSEAFRVLTCPMKKRGAAFLNAIPASDSRTSGWFQFGHKNVNRRSASESRFSSHFNLLEPPKCSAIRVFVFPLGTQQKQARAKEQQQQKSETKSREPLRKGCRSYEISFKFRGFMEILFESIFSLSSSFFFPSFLFLLLVGM